jgi:tRNA1Val (adenine37-N6)-methyltransferase
MDTVTANPPYMAPNSGARNAADEKYIARHEVCGTVKNFSSPAGRLLKHGGRFYCVFRPERLGDLFEGLRSAHLEPKRMTVVQATYAALPSMVLVEAVKYAAPSLLVTPPLCLWEADPARPEKPAEPMVQTADAAYIYENCGFPPRFTGENRK